MTEQSKKKNPLFVVTNAGQDIEEVENWWEYALSKLGLKATRPILKRWFSIYCLKSIATGL